MSPAMEGKKVQSMTVPFLCSHSDYVTVKSLSRSLAGALALGGAIKTTELGQLYKQCSCAVIDAGHAASKVQQDDHGNFGRSFQLLPLSSGQ